MLGSRSAGARRSAGHAGIALLLALAAAAQAQAREAGRFGTTWWGQLGWFGARVASELRVDRVDTAVAGTELVLERDLGLPRRDGSATLLLGARFAGAWRAELEHFALRRSARARALDADIVVDGTVFDVALLVDSRFDSRITRLGVGYAFVDTPQAEAGLTLGVHATDFRIGLRGEAQVDGNLARVEQTQREQLVPLPTVGGFAAWTPASGWRLGGRVDLLPLKARGNSGRLLNLQAQAVRQVAAQAGVGLGWRHVDYEVKGDNRRFKGRVEYRFSGPQVFVEAGF